MIVSNYAIRNRTTVVVLIIIIAIAGAYAYRALPREAAPDVQVPYIIVTTTYPGVAPKDIETSITKEIEKKIKTISDVDKIMSVSREGVSSVTVKFFPTIDIEQARQKVQDMVDDAKGQMPADIDEPTIKEINISEFPIMILNLHGPAGLLKLKDIADDLQDEIERIDGVLEARISGELTRQIRVEVDPLRLAAYEIPVANLLETIAAENQNISGGTLDLADAKYSLRVEGEFTHPAEIYGLIVMEKNGKPIYLSDVAVVSDSFEDRNSISRFDGEESISIAVIKRAGKNIVAIADQVKQIAANYEPRLPTGTRIDITLDASKDIRMMVTDLENNMLTGLFLVVTVLMIALGLRNSAVVGIAIPFSMLITFAVLNALGITLNMVVLFALILVCGMLVDNAIVIVENIYRQMQEGKTRLRAAMEATAEVAWPVAASTATTVVAFLPLLWWPDIVGEFMGYLPKTLMVALTASLLVALIISPTLSSVFVKPRTIRQVGVLEGLPNHWAIRGYTDVLRFALRPRVRLVIVLLAVSALAGSATAFVMLNGKVEFFPTSDPRRAQINITLPVGTRLEVTNAVVRFVEKVVERYRFTDGRDPKRNIRHVTADVGAETTSVGTFLAGGAAGDSFRAQVSVEFIDFEERQVSAMETIESLRRDLAGIPGADIKIDVEKKGPPSGKPISIEVSGDNYDQVILVAEQVKAGLRTIPGVTDLDDDYDAGKPELRVIVDRQRAALMQVSTGLVANFLKAAVNGWEVGKYREGDDDYDIVIRLPFEYRQRVEDIEALTVANAQGKPVPLSAVARIEYTSGLAAIRRIDEKRTITVYSEVVQGYNSNDILRAAEHGLAAATLPPGCSISFTGEKEEQNKAQAFLQKAGIMAVLLIFLILVTEFNSALLPFLIMSAVLLSWIGVFTGLTVTGRPFSIIMTGLGMISLAGIVVNNAIVLIDYTEKLRRRGLALMDAIVRAGAIRMRPVLLTAITTMLGMTPIVFGANLDLRNLQFHTKSESAEWWGPMAIVIVYGLSVATVLTLIVVPIIYVMMDRVRQFWLGHVHLSDSALAEPDQAGSQAVPQQAGGAPEGDS